MRRFFLGTHEPSWLTRTSVPFFLSRRRLAHRRTLPRARGPVAIDSGGFSELAMFGAWRTTPEQYAGEVRRFVEEIGNVEWAAIQDWMCEPFMLEKTGLSLAEHQRRTVDSMLRLQYLAPDLPWAPVLQGWEPDDYRRHADQYAAAGVDLSAAPVVGVGSVCRRQHTESAEAVLWGLAPLGLKLHGFGLKTQGLAKVASLLDSGDSLAWSYNARRNPPLAGCTHSSCANCLRWALRWRDRVTVVIGEARCTVQLPLWGAAA